MNALIATIFSDPILLASLLVLFVTVAILIWSLAALQKLKNTSFDLPEEISAAAPAGESSGLLEARLQEIASQLAQLNQRMSEHEKSAPGSSEDLGKLLQRIEVRLEHISADRSVQFVEELARIEAKLEGVHKLLILLTEGSAPEQK